MLEAGEMWQGRVIDGTYRLRRYLGGSERSAVFLAERSQGSPRTAAIKLIPADPANADLQLSRWKLISRLSHPHLLPILEVGRCRQDGQDLLYVVMEYAEEDLAQVLPSRSLTPAETQEMLKPTLEALAYLHGRGFIHGHLKPSNVLVAGEQLKLSSDGICRIGELDASQAGTYGPPELPGTAAAPPRDIWSLGVLLVQVLTQLLPVRNGNGRKGVTLPETLPPQFVDLAQNCLEPDPERRCTLAEIAEHLHHKLPARTLGPPARPAEPIAAHLPAPVRTVTPARKSSSALLLVAIVAALIAIVGGAKLINRQPAQPETPEAVLEIPAPAQPAAGAGASEGSRQPARAAGKAQITASAQAGPPARAALRTASEVRNVAPAGGPPARQSAPSAGLVAGEVLQQVIPDVPQSASDTIRGTVRVTVKMNVDPAGSVAGVSLVSAGPSRYFARLAVEAARKWKFSPARRDDQAVARAWTVRFEFTRDEARAIPVAAP